MHRLHDLRLIRQRPTPVQDRAAKVIALEARRAEKLERIRQHRRSPRGPMPRDRRGLAGPSGGLTARDLQVLQGCGSCRSLMCVTTEEEAMEPTVITSPGPPNPEDPIHRRLCSATGCCSRVQADADPATGTLGETIEEQTEQTLDNVSTLLEAAGCTLDDVVSCLVHLGSLPFRALNAVYGPRFSDPKPVRTTVGADLLHGMLIEITVTARRRSFAA